MDGSYKYLTPIAQSGEWRACAKTIGESFFPICLGLTRGIDFVWKIRGTKKKWENEADWKFKN